MRRAVLVVLTVLSLFAVACSETGSTGDAGPITLLDGSGADSGATLPVSAPAGACNCDSQCPGTTENPGVCLEGVCMHRAAGDCAEAGSPVGCPTGSRCWGLDGVTGGICWPDCSSFSCAGTCDSDGSCVWSDSTSCDSSCSAICSDGGSGDCPPNAHVQGDGCACDEGFMVNAAGTGCEPEAPPCTAGSCGEGLMCAETGRCILDIGDPPAGPVPSECTIAAGIPDWRCESNCAELVPFDPRRANGYWDYPLNGETEADQYRSFVRRDVMMLVRYAAAMVACQAGDWTGGNGGDLALGDMSEADGSIPGTREGDPGHPAGTHVDGHDMDIGYFQTDTADNRLRPVCPHTAGGADQYHCTGAPVNLDVWRTALLLGHFHASPNLRVIGVDGQVGPLVTSALTQLCAGGWVSGSACTSPQLAYETIDEGRGWFRFHHHHLHISVSSP